jgi:membrane protein required for colicin V production
MTLFDLIALAVIAISALSGFSRGAVHELVGLFAFTVSAMATVAFLPATAPLARHFIHSGWLAAAVAAVVTFAIVFIFLRLLASMLTASLNQGSVLGGANRFGGLVFGGLRGFVFLGLFALVFNRATPQELKPHWITGGLFYPAASAGGRALETVIPKSFHAAGAFAPDLGKAVDAQSGDNTQSTDENAVREPSQGPATNVPLSERAKTKDHRYTKRARDSVDALVEQSK